MSAKKKKGPTFVAKKGNVEVPIYTIKPGCPNQQYVVCHYEGGKRQRRNFSDLEKAKAEATIVAEKLSKGDLEAIRVTGLDRLAYLAAQEHLRPTGVPVELATKEYAAAHRLSNGYPLLEIVRFFNENGGASFGPKKVADVLRELLEVKEGNDLSDVYIKDLRCRLTVFAENFDRDIHTITTAEIQAWLGKLKVAGATKNRYRMNLGTLFRFAAKRRYLPKAHPGISDVEKASAIVGEPEIFTPSEMGTLLSTARPEILPFVAVAAFAGVRHDEIGRLDWSAFDFGEGFIRIKAEVAKMGVPRVIPLMPNLAAWLLPCRKPKGPVAVFANMSKQLCALGEAAGIVWRHNALRHSYASYRLAQTQDTAKVAFECGNSPRMILKHYYKLVTPPEAEKWFKLMPATEANVIQMVQAAAS